MTINEIERFVKVALARESTGHDFGHIKRVYNLVLRIAKGESKADLEVLKVAALLHDLAYTKGFFSGEHGVVSAKLAKPFLKKSGLPASKQKKVIQAIKLHNYWFHKSKNDPIETKILRDADRLEIIGYVGIVREILYCANSQKPVTEGLKELLKLNDEFETKTGKKLAASRLKIVKNFIINLEKESGISLNT